MYNNRFTTTTTIRTAIRPSYVATGKRTATLSTAFNACSLTAWMNWSRSAAYTRSSRPRCVRHSIRPASVDLANDTRIYTSVVTLFYWWSRSMAQRLADTCPQTMRHCCALWSTTTICWSISGLWPVSEGRQLPEFRPRLECTLLLDCRPRSKP